MASRLSQLAQQRTELLQAQRAAEQALLSQPNPELEAALAKQAAEGVAIRQARLNRGNVLTPPQMESPVQPQANSTSTITKAPSTDTSALNETQAQETSSPTSSATPTPNSGGASMSWNITPVTYLEQGYEALQQVPLQGLSLEVQRAILRTANSQGYTPPMVVGNVCRYFVDSEDARMMTPLVELLPFYFANYGGGL